MSRLRGVVVAVGAVLLWAVPASAKVQTPTQSIVVGRLATIEVFVSADEGDIIGVDIGIPKGFTLTTAEVDPKRGGVWQATVLPTRAVFRGNDIAPGKAADFTIHGRAAAVGELDFTVTLLGADHVQRVYDGELGSAHPALVVDVIAGKASGQSGFLHDRRTIVGAMMILLGIVVSLVRSRPRRRA